jgi:hypothetical protein
MRHIHLWLLVLLVNWHALHRGLTACSGFTPPWYLNAKWHVTNGALSSAQPCGIHSTPPAAYAMAAPGPDGQRDYYDAFYPPAKRVQQHAPGWPPQQRPPLAVSSRPGTAQAGPHGRMPTYLNGEHQLSV